VKNIKVVFLGMLPNAPVLMIPYHLKLFLLAREELEKETFVFLCTRQGSLTLTGCEKSSLVVQLSTLLMKFLRG
jgi:hypothetical protein